MDSSRRGGGWEYFYSDDGTKVGCLVEKGFLEAIVLIDRSGNQLELAPDQFDPNVLQKGLGFVPKLH